MKTIVYADSLFLMNFIINMIILKLTDVFSKSKTPTLRLCFSASVGALYAVCMFFPQVSFLYILPFKMFISAVLVFLTDVKMSIVPFIKKCAIFYLVSFTFAGILLATLFFIPEEKYGVPIFRNGILYFNISPISLIITSLVSVFIIWLSSGIFSKSKNMGIKNLKIVLGDKNCILSALSDTGNLLTEPISNLPVIIVDKNFIKPLFPSGIPDCENPYSQKAKIRLIPYSSIGCRSSIMTGFIPDKIVFDNKKEINAIIGISEESLSETKEYGALFNPCILK